jgi:alkanesulfonate monooxygenase SsuD/methylene tetrahydromethanopterin reductase-like flavin-dependent oxidoreductase (luciferase family)
MQHIKAGAAKVGRDLSDFDVVPTVPVIIGDDPQLCAEPLKGYAALYIGGMGSREKNFYNALARRMGYEQEAQQIQDLYLGGDKMGATAAVPFEFVDQTSLLGPADRITDRLQAYQDCGVTTLSITPGGASYDERVETLRTVAEALDKAGVGD